MTPTPTTGGSPRHSIRERAAADDPRRPRSRALLALALGCAALTLAALPLGTPAGAEPSPVPAHVDTGPTLTLSATSGLDPEGQTLTVTGSGYDPAGHVGTRPPLAGRASGIYVVFGRFGTPWQPSLGAPSSARQIMGQVWAVPQDAYEFLNPAGTNPEIVLLGVDGSFSATLEVAPNAGDGVTGVATYPGSGAVNATQELLVPISFSATAPTSTTTTPTSAPPTTVPTTTVPTTTAPTTTAPTTTAPTTTVPTTSSTTTTATPTTSTPVDTAGSASATGANGQQLTVSPAAGLPVEGATVRAVGSGYDPAVGVYVALCVDQGPGVAPSPCVGGVDMEGSGSSSAWISSDPPAYAGDLASPFGPNGSFDVVLTVNAADDYVDCLAEGTRCVIATRADHTAGADRTADVRVPVSFHGQTAVVPEPVAPTATVTLGADSVTAGSMLELAGAGFLAGEQVQVFLLSDPILLTVETADADGAVRSSVRIPATTAPGVHHVELRGLTSGRTVRSGQITVTESATVQPAVTYGAAGTGSTNSASAGPRSLALTGSTVTAVPALLMIALGTLLLMGTRRRNQSTRSIEHPGASR